MGKSQSIRVALIGAGPRGTSVLERLLANWSAAHAASELRGAVPPTLRIDIVDPYPAGSGHVWQPTQSRLYLMNTQSFYPTVIPQDPALAQPLAGAPFDAWRAEMKDSGELVGDGSGGLTADEQAELAALESHHFPSRALYGRYLRSTLEALLAKLPDGAEPTFHEISATSVRRSTKGFDVGLADERTLTVDAVVLALGHVESRLNAEQRSFGKAARSLSLLYVPPAVPADVDWSCVPPGEPVLVRGMGLNFFDVMGQLTEGRGGRFTGTGTELEYVPSGREPRIIAASRRGTPYRAKARLDGYYPKSLRLRYLTEASLGRFAAAGIQPGFDHDLWPLLHRDVVWAYYSTLVASEPAAISEPNEFLAALDDALRPHAHTVGHWEKSAAEVVRKHVAAESRLDLRRLAAPLSGRSFASRADLDAAVVDHLDDDARRSGLGELDPVKMAIGALHTGRAVLKEAVADGGITDESWVADLRGWFEAFVEGLASGPPAVRTAQLAALVRAGVVRFVGPDPKFRVDTSNGSFVAASPWVHDAPVSARSLVEALAPANIAGASDSPLLQQMLADGLVRPKLMMTAEGTPVETTGLDMKPHPYRPVDVNGAVTPGLYVLGLQLSSSQWGTAIAAEAHQSGGPVYPSGQRTLRDADEIARHILSL